VRLKTGEEALKRGAVMFDFLKNAFKKKEKVFSDEEFKAHDRAKNRELEKILGASHTLVNHAIIPFLAGGAVDMYFYPNALPGTAFATQELIQPDGTGPKPNNFGTYELLAFTKHKVDELSEKGSAFNKIERRMCGIFTVIGAYSPEAVLNPKETLEIPGNEGQENKCVIMDEWDAKNTRFSILGKPHGLLLIMEVFRPEMEYAMKNGSDSVIEKLKSKGYYPYSDLDRERVV
jgi:hypothetical protein